MSEPTVRAATSGDVPAIQRVAERSWRAAYDDILSPDTIDAALAEWYDDATLREYVDHETVAYFVAASDGDVVGYVGGGPGDEPDVASLGAIYVDPTAWGEGLGTALLERFEADCRRRHCTTVELGVLAENDVGRAFYEARGFELVEEREVSLFEQTVGECRYRRRID